MAALVVLALAVPAQAQAPSGSRVASNSGDGPQALILLAEGHERSRVALGGEPMAALALDHDFGDVQRRDAVHLDDPLRNGLSGVPDGVAQLRKAGRTRSGHHHHRIHHRPRFTGYRVEGATSTFGYLAGDSEGTTADGGTTRRPCIAIRNDATLDHWFLVEVLGHRARLIQCDYGPGILSRAIDITGLGDEALGFSPSAFPTGAVGVARELRWDGSLSSSSARP
jgi:hypothetical protein